jgi:hypothetical protein
MRLDGARMADYGVPPNPPYVIPWFRGCKAMRPFLLASLQNFNNDEHSDMLVPSNFYPLKDR